MIRQSAVEKGFLNRGVKNDGDDGVVSSKYSERFRLLSDDDVDDADKKCSKNGDNRFSEADQQLDV